MNGLFDFPEETPKAKRASNQNTHVGTSHVITKASKHTDSKDVEYARLTHEDHEAARDTIDQLWSIRDLIPEVLSEQTKNWGRTIQRNSTAEDMLVGVHAKLRKPHPQIAGRKGEDMTIKQVRSINKIVERTNKHLADRNVPHVIPSIVDPSK